MDALDKIQELAKELELGGEFASGVSKYGFVKNVNVRISNHLPTLKCIDRYIDRIKVLNGEALLFFGVVEIAENEEIECLMNDITDYLEEELKVEVRCFYLEIDLDDDLEWINHNIGRV